MLKNILYAILLGVGMAACLADRDNSGEATTDTEIEDGPMTETTEAGTPFPTTNPATYVIA
ncbi:MAG: mechanosensitive ion channel protein MscS, partial [Hymenobacteraceae bacterium]|nr:mechanosensitive ion channel protein MscS [Hymenobacteraceae bacterium]